MSIQRLKERPLSVALVQSESEVLHTPALDLSAFLASDAKTWQLQLFTDRNFEGLIETAGQFDCLVLGFNVLHHTDELVRTLKTSLPETGILVLHQLSEESLGFLPPDLRVGVKRFGATEKHVVLPFQVKPEDEILLRWPEPVEPRVKTGTAALDGSTVCYLEEARADRWRRFFEVEKAGRRFAIGIRTPRTRRPGFILCNLWLEPSRPNHAALLTNMIRYCARGIPDVAVLTAGDDERLSLLARKVELQGVKVVQLPVPADSGSAPFAAWPLRRVERAVVPQDRSVDASWMQRGGIVVRVAGTGDLTLRGGVPDQQWIAQRWGSWFSGVPPERWHGGTLDGDPVRGSIFQSRAILRMLHWVASQSPESVSSLSLPAPSAFAGRMSALIKPRLDERGGVDGTISSSAAACDISRLTGGKALTGTAAKGLDKWLRAEFQGEHTSIADRLDIARALRDPVLLEDALNRLRAGSRSANDATLPGVRPLDAERLALSPMIMTRLRQACIDVYERDAVKVNDVAGLLKDIEEDVGSDLGANLLLAAEYLEAKVTFEQRFGSLHPDLLISGEHTDANVESAIGVLAKHGRLVRLGEDDARWDPVSVNGESISTEALSLVAYFGKQPLESVDSDTAITNTHFVSSRSRGLPDIAVNQLIGEVQKSRKALAQASTKLAAQERVLRVVRQVLSIMGLAAAALVTWAWIAWDTKPAPVNNALGTVLGVAIAATAVVLVKLILSRLGLSTRWLDRVAEPALDLAGTFKPILSAMQRKKPDRPPNA